MIRSPRWHLHPTGSDCARTRSAGSASTRVDSITKKASLIVAVLSCFDRVLFKGDLPLTNGPALEGFVDHVLKIRRCDFLAFAEQQSETLVSHAKRRAPQAGVEYRFLRPFLQLINRPWASNVLPLVRPLSARKTERARSGVSR
jgi:hypothetical protein